MGFFKRRKRKKEMEEFLEQYPTQGDAISQKHQPEHQALAYCEQMIAISKELEETRKEYRLVTDYLNDIQTLENLPQEDMAKIQEFAQSIVSLDQVREEYTHKKKRLSDAQFAQMEQLEDEIPEDIRRLSANESYQSMVKRDMDNLEGEKSEWIYYIESLTKEQKWLKAGLWILLAVFVAGVCVIEYIQHAMYKDLNLVLMCFVFLVAVIGGGCILRMQNNRRELKHGQACINRAITISNQMKAKYVNITNAVDYACEKFHVRNAMELTYLWEQYMEAVKEQKALEKNNEDLEYFCRRLVRELKQYQLYDAAIWAHQANAIVDKKEMVEVKHYMIVRRQKLRSLMEQQVADIQEMKKQMLSLLENKKEYQKEILDVLKSIDQVCGLQ